MLRKSVLLCKEPVCRVTEKARQLLSVNPYTPIRRVGCKFNEGVLVLSGRLDTFFHKQLAQEAVARLEGVSQVVNDIEVVEIASSAQPSHAARNLLIPAWQWALPGT